MILLLLLLLVASFLLWLAGLVLLWWGTWTPRPGQLRLVRTCDRWIACVHDEVTVKLWPSAHDLPAEQKELKHYRVVLVLDHSGSMGAGPGSPLDHAREAAIAFAENVVSDRCQVGVVEFDDQASTVHPLSASKAALITALHSILPGGGTDIAFGLQQARIALQDASAPPSGTERIVVLLSDGGSAEDPAILAAEALTKERVRVVTIALGAYVNGDLLRRIASSDDDFFHTLDPANLVRLYAIIGASLDAVRGYRACVDESVDTEQFLVSATGDAAPYEIAFNQGVVKWFVPFVSAQPKAIPYQIVPMRSGWRRIARRRAGIEMVDRNGLPHRGESNLSPHLLVLPCGWWPWLAVFFNPLFWILWDLLFRRRRAQPAIQVPPVPEAIPLPKAEPVEAAPRQAKKGKLSPTVVIGLGYCGSLVVRALRYHLNQLVPSPEGLDSIRYLWIDTGVDSQDDLKEWAPFGEPVPAEDCLLMPDNVEPLFERLRGASAPPPHLAWLDVNRERQALVHRDYDLSRGTARRRTLGRAAFYRHLEAGPQAALRAALLDRLASVKQPYRVVLTGDIAGGTAGGVLLDLVIYLRKLIRELDHDNVVVDALLLTHRMMDNVTEPAYFRNTLAFATELSRLSLRRRLSLRVPQTPDEGNSPPPIRELLDSVLLLEHPLEPPTDATRWPGPAVHSAAEVILQMALDEGAGPASFLNGQLGAARDLERSTGAAVVFGAGSSSRWLPLMEGRRLLTAQTVLSFLASDFLFLERRDGNLAPTGGKELREAAQECLVRLLSGRDLARPLPALLSSMAPLADEATAAPELDHLIRQMHVFPGSTQIPMHVGGNALEAEILNNQEALLAGLLEEWALGILNGGPERDRDADPAVRRGAFIRLAGAVESLQSLCEACIKNLDGMADSVHRQSDPRRFEFIRYLFLRYRGLVSGLNRHVLAWNETLLSAAEQADRAAASAQRRIRTVLDELSPYAQWPQELGRKYEDPGIREELLRQVMWSAVPAPEGFFRLRLRVQGVADERLREGPDQVQPLREALDALVPLIELNRRGLDYWQEDIGRYVDLEKWSRAARTDPIDADQNVQVALASSSFSRRDFLVVHRDPGIPAAGPETIASPHRQRAATLRFLSGCALFATTAVLDYQRRRSGEPHAKLPFLDPVDRQAAVCEDRFTDFGLNAPLLCPAIRAYFENWEMFRAFSLAHAVGLLAVRIGDAREVLYLAQHDLTDERIDEARYPLLMQALDNFVHRGQTASGGDLDRVEVASLVGGELAKHDDRALAGLAKGAEEAPSSYLLRAPLAVRDDFLKVMRLFVELELERRNAAGR